MKNPRLEAGEVNPLLISTILFALLAVIFGGVMTWALLNYSEQKNNVDGIVAEAVDKAKQEQAEEGEREFSEREKAPFRSYSGPADLGSVRFDYPKTWSVYEAVKGTDNTLKVYLHPLVVPPVDSRSSTALVALQVEVRNEAYDAILEDYQDIGDEGALKAEPYRIGEYAGMRFSGQISDEQSGTIVMFKVRDKTLILTTYTDAFVKDLDSIILKTLKFNP